MRLRSLPMLLLGCLLTSCKVSGVEVQVCVSDPERGGFQCYDQKTNEAKHVKYVDSDGFVAFTPDDAQKLLNACGKR